MQTVQQERLLTRGSPPKSSITCSPGSPLFATISITVSKPAACKSSTNCTNACAGPGFRVAMLSSSSTIGRFAGSSLEIFIIRHDRPNVGADVSAPPTSTNYRCTPNIGEWCVFSTFPLPRYMWTPHGRQGSKLRTVRMMSMPLNLSGPFSSKIGVFCTASS